MRLAESQVARPPRNGNATMHSTLIIDYLLAEFDGDN